MEILNTIRKYIDPAYNLYISIPPEIVRYKEKYAYESNLKTNTWYNPSLFASAIAIATLKLFPVDLYGKDFSKPIKSVSLITKRLYDSKIGGFRDSFNDKSCSIQGTRSALRIINLLLGNEEKKWKKNDINSSIVEFLEDKYAIEKIINFVHSNFNPLDGGYTNTPHEKYSDIFSTSSASWILYQLGVNLYNVDKKKSKEFAKNICSLIDKNGHIQCRSVVDKDSDPTLRATAQYIDMHNNNIENYKFYNNKLFIPHKWKYNEPKIKKSIIDLYNSLRVESIDLEDTTELRNNSHIIISSLDEFEYKGGYCFFTGKSFVPNLLATYYALVILIKIRNINLANMDVKLKPKNIAFIKSCFSTDGIFRFYPFSRKYYRNR